MINPFDFMTMDALEFLNEINQNDIVPTKLKKDMEEITEFLCSKMIDNYETAETPQITAIKRVKSYLFQVTEYMTARMRKGYYLEYNGTWVLKQRNHLYSIVGYLRRLAENLEGGFEND